MFSSWYINQTQNKKSVDWEFTTEDAKIRLPCLVILLTITREQSLRFALLLLSKQAIAAIVFSLLLAWGGLLIK